MKRPVNKQQFEPKKNIQKRSKKPQTSQFIESSSEPITKNHKQDLANNSASVKQLKRLQEVVDNSSIVKKTAQLQGIADNYIDNNIYPSTNNTGLPLQLKSNIENLSGHSLDDVKVHYNSNKPKQLQAHAYAQGTDIHLGPGQEKHLPHETWHVVQQKQGRVKPTLQMKGNISVNDDQGLEKEADIMGAKASQSSVLEKNINNSGLSNTLINAPVLQGNFTYTASVILDRDGAAKKKADTIRIDSIDLPEVERPPTQYGEKQQAHSVSWTLLKQAYSNMKAGPLINLLNTLKSDWATLRKQSDLKKNKDAHKQFNQYLHKYNDAFFGDLIDKSSSFLNWYGVTQNLVTDYFVALQLSALATHTGYTSKIDAVDATIHEHQPLGHGEPAANAYFQELEQNLAINPANQSDVVKKAVLQHAKYYWDPGIGFKGGINETAQVQLIIEKYEHAFSRAYPRVWANYHHVIQNGFKENGKLIAGISKGSLDLVDKYNNKGHSTTNIEKLDDPSIGDENLEEQNTGGFQATVKLSEEHKAGAAPASAYQITSYEIISIALPNDRPVTKYGIIGQKSHTVSWTLVIQALNNLGKNKQLSGFLQALLTRWDDLARQPWDEMINSNLISGTDLQRRKILNTVENIKKYNERNAARLSELKDKIPTHIALLHRMVKGESFTDVEWAHQVQKAIADYVVVYQSSPLATFKSEPNPKGHGEPDANDWLKHINKHIDDKNMAEIADKYMKDSFKGMSITKSNFKGNDKNDKERAVELGKLHKDDKLEPHLEEVEQKLVKHLALKYLDVNWNAVGSDLDTSPKYYSQILSEWEEAIEKAFPKVWQKHGNYLKTYAESILLSDSLQSDHAKKLGVMGNDPENLTEDQKTLKPWMREERSIRSGKRGLLSIQAGDETTPDHEEESYKQAKQDYNAGRIAAHNDPATIVDAEASNYHKEGHKDYLDGLALARNSPGLVLPEGVNLAFKIGFSHYQDGYNNAKSGNDLALDASASYREGHQYYSNQHAAGYQAALNGNPLVPGQNEGFNNGHQFYHDQRAAGYQAALNGNPLVPGQNEGFINGHQTYSAEYNHGFQLAKGGNPLPIFPSQGHINGHKSGSLKRSFDQLY